MCSSHLLHCCCGGRQQRLAAKACWGELQATFEALRFHLHPVAVRVHQAIWCGDLQIEPKGDRVLVRVAEQEQKTKGGILLPIAAQKRPTSG